MKQGIQAIKGQTALVTGGAGLLGLQHAMALLEIGARVILLDIVEVALENAKDALKRAYPEGNVLIFQADITSKVSILACATQLEACGIDVDILINNAASNPTVQKNIGDFPLDNSVENFSLEKWNSDIAVNLTGSFLCAQIFGSKMAAGSGGVIVNIASDLSVISPDNRIYSDSNADFDARKAKPISYSVSKSAILGLTRYLATYWATKGVRVNALSPGGVYVDQPEDFVERLTALIPVGRMANVDEYKGAIQFLCSPASSYMTGQNLIVDGGRTAW